MQWKKPPLTHHVGRAHAEGGGGGEEVNGNTKLR